MAEHQTIREKPLVSKRSFWANPVFAFWDRPGLTCFHVSTLSQPYFNLNHMSNVSLRSGKEVFKFSVSTIGLRFSMFDFLTGKTCGP